MICFTKPAPRLEFHIVLYDDYCIKLRYWFWLIVLFCSFFLFFLSTQLNLAVDLFNLCFLFYFYFDEFETCRAC